jgi:hypothetical protein
VQFRVFEVKQNYGFRKGRGTPRSLAVDMMDSKDDSQAKYVLNMPLLKLTSAKECLSNHHYIWKPVVPLHIND